MTTATIVPSVDDGTAVVITWINVVLASVDDVVNALVTPLVTAAVVATVELSISVTFIVAAHLIVFTWTRVNGETFSKLVVE